MINAHTRRDNAIERIGKYLSDLMIDDHNAGGEGQATLREGDVLKLAFNLDDDGDELQMMIRNHAEDLYNAAVVHPNK